MEGRADLIVDLRSPGTLESLKDHPFKIKEGSTFRLKVKFRVQNQVLSGLKYVQVSKRGPLSAKMQEMIVGTWTILP